MKFKIGEKVKVKMPYGGYKFTTIIEIQTYKEGPLYRFSGGLVWDETEIEKCSKEEIEEYFV